MCRLAAFPPLFSRERAIKILLDFENMNKDGVGSVFIQPDGEFKVEKFPFSLTQLLEKEQYPFLSHMPYNGWTLAHLRAASHGCNADRNTHPFIIGDMAVVHNGIWSDYGVSKVLLQKFVGKMEGETDSEVAGHLLKTIGPKKFSQVLDHAGVFMALHKNGTLDIVKTSGDLEIWPRSDKSFAFASVFPFGEYKKSSEVEEGWYRYNRHGKFVKQKIKPSPFAEGGKWYRLGGKQNKVYSALPYTPYKPYIPNTAGQNSVMSQYSSSPIGTSTPIINRPHWYED